MDAKSQLVHNFSAGPGALPKKVIERVRNDFPNWNGTGMSITEISHRSKDFIECASKAENNLRSLLNVPDDYHVLFFARRSDSSVFNDSHELGRKKFSR